MVCGEGVHIPLAFFGAIICFVYGLVLPGIMYHTLRTAGEDGRAAPEFTVRLLCTCFSIFAQHLDTKRHMPCNSKLMVGSR